MEIPLHLLPTYARFIRIVAVVLTLQKARFEQNHTQGKYIAPEEVQARRRTFQPLAQILARFRRRVQISSISNFEQELVV